MKEGAEGRGGKRRKVEKERMTEAPYMYNTVDCYRRIVLLVQHTFTKVMLKSTF